MLSKISFKTSGEGFIDITPSINHWIKHNKVRQGILVVSLQHTSCSLIINENADPLVLKDLSNYMNALVPQYCFKSLGEEGEQISYFHSQEGPDDMPAHIRTTLTCSSLSLSICKTKLLLGIWQAIYLWEHRQGKHSRELYLHAIGEIGNTI